MWKGLQQPPIQPVQLNDRFLKTYSTLACCLQSRASGACPGCLQAFSCKARGIWNLHADCVLKAGVLPLLDPKRKGQRSQKDLSCVRRFWVLQELPIRAKSRVFYKQLKTGGGGVVVVILIRVSPLSGEDILQITWYGYPLGDPFHLIIPPKVYFTMKYEVSVFTNIAPSKPPTFPCHLLPTVEQSQF